MSQDSLKILSENQLRRCSTQFNIYKNLCDEFMQDYDNRYLWGDSFGKYQQKANEMESFLNLVNTQRILKTSNNDLKKQKLFVKILLGAFLVTFFISIFLFVRLRRNE